MIDHRLETFVTLAKLQNYTTTAKELNLTQPAVTQHIQYLEDSYGVPLITRDRKGPYLTAEGEMLLEYANRVLALATGIRRALRNKTGIVKRYNIGATLTIGEYILPQILSRHKKEHGDIDISMIVQNTEAVLKRLEIEDIDLGVVEGPFNRSKYEHRLLKKDSLVLVVASDHRLAGRDKVGLEELWREKLIVRERGSGTRTVFENSLLGRGYSLSDFSSYTEIGNLNAIRTLVTENLGITVISTEVVRTELASGVLKAIAIESMSLEREFRFVYLPQNRTNDFLHSFMDFCLEFVSQGKAEGP